MSPASSPSDLPAPPARGSSPDAEGASKWPCTTPAVSRVPTRRFRSARVTAAAVLAGAVVIGSGAFLPAAASPVSGPAAAPAGPGELTSVEHGYPGYFSSLSVVEDELSAEANHLTVKADFCLHPEATANDGVGFDIMGDAPIGNWDQDGTFRPAQWITRGEVARVLTQVHERLVQR